MHHVTIITGKQGSGKTTFANHYVKETSTRYAITSPNKHDFKTSITRCIVEKIDTLLIDEIEFDDSRIYLFKDTITLRLPYSNNPTSCKMPRIVIVTCIGVKKIKSILKHFNIKNYTLLTIN